MEVLSISKLESLLKQNKLRFKTVEELESEGWYTYDDEWLDHPESDTSINIFAIDEEFNPSLFERFDDYDGSFLYGADWLHRAVLIEKSSFSGISLKFPTEEELGLLL